MNYNNQEYTVEDLELFTEEELKQGLQMLQEQQQEEGDVRC